jgi:hypothetical protein
MTTLGPGQAPDCRLFLELSPVVQERIAQRNREVSEALQKFEALPRFSRVLVRMHKKLDKLRETSSSVPRFDHEGWACAILSFLDVRAKTFLNLVSTLEMQNAFIVMLGEFGRTAWQEYIGLPVPPEVAQPEGSVSENVYQMIFERTRHWVTKGYECIANIEDTRPPVGSAPMESKRVQDRRARVNAFLTRCNQEPNLGVKLIRKHIWQAVKHTHARQFHYWQSQHPKATEQNDRDFNRILAMDASNFVALLKKMTVI